ncbi:hypothetical protein [Paraburkholderia sp. HD33-4]|uniref:hypothetical protein n=1 Tax=Paraburkholderia sp. HD33-4 TaxID=2883242 RepID=UPI001F1E3322|nr:hypothetical protein [Paraburkholderia sp. HD33-4]
MARPRLPRDPAGNPIRDSEDPYLMARQTVRDNFNDLLRVALEQAKSGDSAFLVRLLGHLESQPTRVPGVSADGDPANIASDIARWAAVGGVSVETARKMIALLRETQAFVKRSKTIDALIHAYETSGQTVPPRVDAMRGVA